MRTTVNKEFLGNTFTYTTEVNNEGKALWTQEIDRDFSKWLHQLKEHNRELFKIQYSISTNAYEVLGKLKEKIAIYDDSLIIRAITITFINFIDTRKGKPILKKLNSYKESEELEALSNGEILKKNLYFSPVGMRDVEAYSNLTGMKKGQVIRNALYSVLLISIHEDEEIKKFWENEIIENLTFVAKAA